MRLGVIKASYQHFYCSKFAQFNRKEYLCTVDLTHNEKKEVFRGMTRALTWNY